MHALAGYVYWHCAYTYTTIAAVDTTVVLHRLYVGFYDLLSCPPLRQSTNEITVKMVVANFRSAQKSLLTGFLEPLHAKERQFVTAQKHNLVMMKLLAHNHIDSTSTAKAALCSSWWAAATLIFCSMLSLL